MPSKVCSVCKRLQEVSAEDWKYLSPTADHICSKECVLKWIRAHTMYQGWWKEKDIYIRPIVSTCFRSLYELAVFKVLQHCGIEVLYERYTFLLGGKATYTPDFCCVGHGFFEVKGAWGVGSKTKMRKFNSLYPDIPLLVIPWTIRRDFGYTGEVPDIG